tara:strand:+ start:114 stop:293 length:180 start_codon:yes stop_codon:yes gene_type:complete
MNNDFFIAILTGWIILSIFWFGTILFIFIRKPTKSKLNIKIIIGSLVFFLAGFLFLIIF